MNGDERGEFDFSETEVDWREDIHRKHQGHYIEHLGFVGRDLEEPTDKPSLDTVWTTYTCSACGQVVRDRGLHDRWGSLMNRLIEELADLSEAVGPLLPPGDEIEAMEAEGQDPS